jgi:hypothetical protein
MTTAANELGAGRPDARLLHAQTTPLALHKAAHDTQARTAEREAVPRRKLRLHRSAQPAGWRGRQRSQAPRTAQLQGGASQPAPSRRPKAPRVAAVTCSPRFFLRRGAEHGIAVLKAGAGTARGERRGGGVPQHYKRPDGLQVGVGADQREELRLLTRALRNLQTRPPACSRTITQSAHGRPCPSDTFCCAG